MKGISRNIEDMKEKKYIEQDGICAGCGEKFKFGDIMELAHRIPQRRWIIRKFGEQYIHHELNMKLTHSGNCNSAVQMSPNKTELVKQHIEMIQKAIDQNR